MARDHGFAFYELECFPRGWPCPELKGCWELSRHDFVEALNARHARFALEWGFPPGAVALVHEFTAAGVRVVWFDGNVDRAREAFIDRGGIDARHFDVQVDAIRGSGLPNGLECEVVEVLSDRGEFKQPATIAAEIFRS